MRLLLCCESYYPQRGGVQEVMRQIAERMVKKGHDVTVATSRHPKRKSTVLNGVKIRDFRAGGKMPYGLHGEIDKYRQFVEEFNADAILLMAAQQWSFDALWPVLDKIGARKVFIPCGFSCLYEPDFADYYRQIPEVLRKFDHLVFNAERYRDIDFVRALGLTNLTVLPNGVGEQDFDQPRDPNFRRRLGISEKDFVFLTVGNPIEAKGHNEVIEAFSRLDTEGRPATLVSVANWPRRYPKFVSRWMTGLRYAHGVGRRVLEVAQLEGMAGVRQRARRKLLQFMHRNSVQMTGLKVSATELKVGATEAAGSETEVVGVRAPETLEDRVQKITAQSHKRVLMMDLTRSDLVQAYMAADLFVFASRIEYSPLVLFEAAAAGTPFLTVPVGNADEIVRWTGGGMLCEAAKDDRGYTRVDPQVLSLAMARCMKKRDWLQQLGTTAQGRFRKHFTWSVVAGYYEAILCGRNPDVRIEDDGPLVYGLERASGVT